MRVKAARKARAMIEFNLMPSAEPVLSDRFRAYWKQSFPVLLVTLAVFAVSMAMPPVALFADRDPGLLQAHLILEVLAVIVAVMIAMVAWHSLDAEHSDACSLLVAGFLTVAAMDLFHALTYDGMPRLITENSTPKGIFFWLMARSVAVLTLLLVALDVRPRVQRWQTAALAAVVSMALFWFGTYHLDLFPLTFIAGTGVTAFKTGFEITLSVAYAVAAALFIIRSSPQDPRRPFALATASVIMALGELLFALYLAPSDFLNGFGHVFKIASYLFLYQALVVANVRKPFELARQSEAELRATTQQLHAQREALELTYTGMSQGIAKFDADGRINFFNPRFMELLDFPREFLATHPCLEEIARFQRERGDFSERDDFSDPQIREWIGTGQHRRLPAAYVRKSRGGASVEVRTHYLPDGGMVRTYTDMSSYFRVTETLQTERERLSNLLEGTRAGTWYWNAQTDEAEVDERWAAIVGYTAADYRAEHGQKWMHRVHPGDVPEVHKRMRAHLRGETDHLEVEFRSLHKDGHWVWIQSRGQVHSRGPDGRALLVSGIHIDISSIKQTQEALVEASLRLSENTRLLETTLGSISQGICMIGTDGRLNAYNERARELLNLPESLLARHPTIEEITRFQTDRGDLGPGQALVPPEARAYIAAGGRGPSAPVYVRRTTEGRVIEVRSGNLPGGGMVRTFTDVTDYVDAREALERSEARIRVITESARDPIVTMGADFTLTYANPAAALVFRRDRASFEGLSVIDLFPLRESDAALAALRDAIAGARAPSGWLRPRWARRADGSEFMAEISMASGTVGGETVNTLMLRDVSERMEAEAEIRRLNESLEHRVAERTEALERSMKDMEAISYSIAHDLRAPLQAVNGFASLLEQRERGTLSAQSRSMLQRIQGASRNMAQMIDDLLALFRVVRAELVMTPVDMEKLAHGAVAALDVGGATVSIGALPPAQGDSTLLRQVFMNLIDNAVKYSRGVPSPHVEVGYEPATDAWFVRDNGVGFEMAYADKLFGVFQRLHAVADFQGSGVGLSVVSRIVERHGGRIWAEAAVGRGATFRFTFGPHA